MKAIIIENGKRHGRAYAFFILFVATFLWGIQVVPLKFLLAEWSSLTITCARYFLLSGIILAGVYWRRREFLPPRAAIRPLVLMGLCLFLNNFIQIMGIKYTSATNAALITATNPVNTAIFAWLILREHLRPIAWLGIVISFFGVLMVVTDGNASAIWEMRLGIGDVLCYVGIACWGLYAIAAPAALRLMSAPLATAWAALVAACITIPCNWLVHEINFAPLSASGILSFLFVLFCGGIISNVLWNEGVELVGPSEAAMFSNVNPISGMAAGYFIMGDEITMAKLCGTALALFGVRLATAHRA